MTLENLYRADKVIFEVNARAPMVWGENALPVSMADVLYEVDQPIYQLQDPPIGEKEETIAGYVTEMMGDGDCIQLGFGGIPNAIGFHLMEKHDLGIHTEQIGTSMAHLMACGAVTNRYKTIDRGITVGSFISGDNFLYDFVDQHPRLTVRRSRYTNDPYVIARNDNVVSVNASLQIDLTGQVCAESIGPYQHSGTGGATDFAWGAYHSKGGAGHPGPDVHHEKGDPLPHRAHPGPGGHCVGLPEPDGHGGHRVRRGQAPPAHRGPAGGEPHRRGPPRLPGRAAEAGRKIYVLLIPFLLLSYGKRSGPNHGPGRFPLCRRPRCPGISWRCRGND